MRASATLEHFGYRYPSWSELSVPVLDAVDVEISAGLTLVTGESGSGKSTLLRVLNGLVPHFHGGAVSGRATVCGMDVLQVPTRRLARHVGFVFQEPEAGFVRGTVTREVAFAPENLGLPADAIRRRVEEALERTGVAHLSGRRIRTLSGGERQRVALAAVLAAAPSLLVMDEPTSQLDENGARDLAAVVRGLASDCAVVVAGHRFAAFPPAASHLVVGGGQVTAAPVADVHGEVAGPPSPPPSAPAGAKQVFALHGVSIGVGGLALVVDLHVSGLAGEVVVVTGPNGSGKTTLLRTIAGLAEPLGGRVERDPGRVAYLPQEPGVLLHRDSVRAEIEQTLRWTGSKDGPGEVLRLFGLDGLAERDPRDLSVGQRQRAATAAVLAGDPALVLLDEPTRGMDSGARRSLHRALEHVAATGACVVLATHDDDLARELGARVLRIEDCTLKPVTTEAAR